MGRFSSLWETAKDATDTIRAMLEVGAVVAAIFFAVFHWLSGLHFGERIALGVVIGMLVLVGVTYFIDWKRKRDVERIPDLVEKLDVLVSNYVDNFDPELSQEDWGRLYDDYTSILGIDFNNLKEALRSELLPSPDGKTTIETQATQMREPGAGEIRKSKKGKTVQGKHKEAQKPSLEREFQRVSRQYASMTNPQNQTEKALTDMGDIGGLLDSYNIGLAPLKTTNEYKRLERQIRSLQRQAPSAFISVQVNQYFIMSERLYYTILSTRSIHNNPAIKRIMPATIKAKDEQLRPVVAGQIANLISGVRESVLKYKERNAQTAGKDDKGKKS